MKNKILWVVIVLIVIGIGIETYYNSRANHTSVIKVGVLSPLTGNFAFLGEDFSIGVRISARENKNIVLVEEDTASDPKTAISAMNKLVAEGVKIFVGGPSSSVNLALAPIAARNGVILIAESKTAKIDTAGEYIFRALPLVDTEARMMADFISNKSIKNVAIIFDSSSDTAIMAKDAFEEKFKVAGGTIVVSEGFDSKTVNDFRTLVLKIKNSNPGAVYLATTEAPSGPLIKQLKELGSNAPLFGWSVHDTDRLINTAGTAVEGLIITAEPFACDRDRLTSKYCSSYADMAGSITPQYYGAYGYDILNNIASLVRKDGSDIEKIREHLSNIQNMKGVVGNINTDAKGNLQKNDFVFKVFKNGKIVKLDF